MKKSTIIIIGILIMISLLICVFIFTKNNKKENNLLIEIDKIVLNPNDNYTIKALTYPNEEKITYESSNNEVITVDENGAIFALKEGIASISVISKSDERIIDITVTNNQTKASGITIGNDKNSLNVSEKYLLELQVYPTDALTPLIILESSNEDVIKEENGFLESLKQGSSQITVKALVDDEKLLDTINLVVGENENIEPTKIGFYEEIVTIKLNETYKLEPLIEPINTTNKDIIYTIEDEDIIEIENNIIKAKNNGETKVTATLGSKSAEIIVKVKSSDELVLNTEEISIAKGETYSLKSNFVSGIDWYSSNNRIATVTNGLVKGINEGTAVITIINKYGRISKAKVTVSGNGILVNSVAITDNEIKISSGNSYQLSAIVTPINATNKQLIFETTDSRIATVNDEGLITGKSNGTCYITAFSSNNKNDTVKVTVKNGVIALDSLEINPSSITIMKNDSYQLTANFIPSNVENKNITWSSDNEKIATVKDGLITGLKTGTATIYAKSNGLTSQIDVTVKNLIIDIASVNIKENNISLKEGEKSSLNITYLPSNATNKKFVFKSSNPNIATVNNKGLITGISKGTTTISVTSTNGKNDIVNVTVTAKDTPSDSGITEIIMSSENVNLQMGEVKKIRTTILPLNASQKVTWVSSDESIVTVNDGTLTAIKNGTATVAAIATNGMIAKAKIAVTYPPIYSSGTKLLELNSNTLIVSMTQNPSSEIKIIRVWAQDPYNQFHKVSVDKPALISTIMNETVQTRNLQNSILVGGNGSFTTGSHFPVANFIITEGQILLNNPGGSGSKDFGNAVTYSGINSDGDLKVYCTKPEKNCVGFNGTREQGVFNSIINDGVKSTIAVSFENILVLNGKRVNDPGWMNRYAIRHTFCQVNKNNFIFTVSSNGDKVIEVASLLEKLGCQTAINLDGGGSANSFYKNKGSSTVNMIRSTNRPRPGAIYFSEF